MRFIQDVKDYESLITDELHDLAMWLKENTLSTTISCFQTMLPSKLKPTTNNKKIVKEKWVKLTDEEVSLTPKQLEAYLYAREHQPLTYTELRKSYPGQARTLIEKNAIILEEKEKEAVNDVNVNIKSALQLTALQQSAMDEINNSQDGVSTWYHWIW